MRKSIKHKMRGYFVTITTHKQFAYDVTIYGYMGQKTINRWLDMHDYSEIVKQGPGYWHIISGSRTMNDVWEIREL